MDRQKENNLSLWLRLAGLLPLFMFLARLRFFMNAGTPGHILWMCHITNLILALGLFFGVREFVRISVLWLIIGMPLWALDMARFGIRELTTFGTHIGGLIVGLIAISRVRGGQKSWLYALVFYLVLQLVCRIITPPELNVNTVHSVYRGWEKLFTNYQFFWVVITVLSGVVLWGIGKAFVRLFPPMGDKNRTSTWT